MRGGACATVLCPRRRPERYATPQRYEQERLVGRFIPVAERTRRRPAHRLPIHGRFSHARAPITRARSLNAGCSNCHQLGRYIMQSHRDLQCRCHYGIATDSSSAVLLAPAIASVPFTRAESPKEGSAVPLPPVTNSTASRLRLRDDPLPPRRASASINICGRPHVPTSCRAWSPPPQVKPTRLRGGGPKDGVPLTSTAVVVSECIDASLFARDTAGMNPTVSAATAAPSVPQLLFSPAPPLCYGFRCIRWRQHRRR